MIVILNSYVDFDDYDNVIKTYADDTISYSLYSGTIKESEVYLRNNHVILADDFFQVGQTERKQFYSVANSKLDFTNDPTGDIYANIILRMEAREDTYERTVFSVFDFTGLIGGVFEILEVTGSILVGFFANKLFMF